MKNTAANLLKGMIGVSVALAVLHSDAPAARLAFHGPITDQILMLHFLDGEYDHDRRWDDGTFRDDPLVYKPWDEPFGSKLDTAQASQVSRYTIASSDDADFAGGANPVAVGRKTKAHSFAGINSGGKIDGIQLGYLQYLQHWLYLRLPARLKRGSTYTISGAELAEPIQFTFSEYTMRNEAIHVNHLGYAPQAAAKYAYVSHYLGDLGGIELDGYDGAAFHIVKDGTEEAVFSGTMTKRRDYETGGPEAANINRWFWNPSGSYTASDVWECNFSAFQGEPGYGGDYRVVVEGLGASYPFTVHTDGYGSAFRAVMHAIYLQRSGIPKEKPYTKWVRPARIPPGTVYKQSTEWQMEKSLTAVTGEEYTNVWGGYNDAADFDKLEQHWKVPRDLLTAFELRPEVFTDGELNIPESGNGVPDILDEAAWWVAYQLRMQKPDGACVAGANIFSDQWYLYAPSPRPTYCFSAVANQLAHCLELAHLDRIPSTGYYSDVDLSVVNLRAKAKKAYDWAVANHTMRDSESKPEWTDHSYEHYHAHMWMFRATGEKQYMDAFKLNNPITKPDSLFPEYKLAEADKTPWNMEQPAMAFLMADTTMPNIDKAYRDIYHQSFDLWYTWDRLDAAAKRGMRQAWHWRMPPGLGNQTAPEIKPLAVGYFALGERKWLDNIYTTLDYHLGGNQMNTCWVAKMGHRSPEQIMVQGNWAPYVDTLGAPWGVVPYGDGRKRPLGQTNSVAGYAYNVTLAYPLYVFWGENEHHCENRFHAFTNEYTIHQTLSQAAFGYGVMKDGGPTGVAVSTSPRSGGRVASGQAAPRWRISRPGGTRIAVNFGAPGARTMALVDLHGRTALTVHSTGATTTLAAERLARGTYVLRIDGQRRSLRRALTIH